MIGKRESDQIHPRSRAKEMEELLGVSVHLFLFLKVKEDWGDDRERFDTWALISTLEKSSFFASYSAHDTRRPAFLSYSFRGRLVAGAHMAFDQTFGACPTALFWRARPSGMSANNAARELTP